MKGQNVAVVTGGSSSIGKETALTLARNEFMTHATTRNVNKGENMKSLTEREKLPLKVVTLDVTKDASVNKIDRWNDTKN
jgi:NADP-dependent 3-hydroxy acid dehydrogenase YdfG